MGHELFLTNIRKIILGINLIYLFVFHKLNPKYNRIIAL